MTQRIRAIIPDNLEGMFGDTRSKCRACSMSETSYPVHPRGNFKSKISFIAEAAGLQEEKHNLVFNGPAADLLEKGLGRLNIFPDIDFFIYNVCLCRPHPPAGSTKENRSPTVAEIKACRGNLEALMRAHNPTLVIACGGVAASALMNNYPGKVGDVIGKFYGPGENIFGLDSDLYVIWHPAYVLRNMHQEGEWMHQLVKLRDYMTANKLFMPRQKEV